MGLYLYAVGDAGHPAPAAGLAGVDGHPVRVLDLAGFRLWVSETDRAPGASLDRVRQHNEVVEAAAEDRTPLPMRFGQWFASERELADLLEERRGAMTAGLERVHDAVELGVRVVDPTRTDPAPPERTSGTAYLEGLARRESQAEDALRRGRAVAEELRSFLGAVVRAERVRPGGETGIAAIAHLVARHDTGTYHRQLRTFSDRHPDLRFITSGPWPPYGFADDAS